MSKKLLLGLLALASAQTAAVAQQRPGQSLDRALLRQTRPVKINRMPTDNSSGGAAATTSNRAQAATPASWGTMIGQTTYDLQTNRAPANRIAADGSNMTNVWTQTCVVGTASAYPNRGIGHNVSNDGGQTWLRGSAGNCPSNYGISDQRVGWPEIAYVNGFEFAAAHNGSGIVTTRRPIGGGTGAWPATTVLSFTAGINGSAANGTWPRVTTSGNYVHMVYCSNDGANPSPPQPPSLIVNPMLYARSSDGGVSWDQQNILLPMMDSTHFASIGGDQYAVNANGNTVAITTGAFGDNVIVWKSTDNGDNFTPRTIVGDYTAADTLDIDGVPGGDSATVIAPDGSMSLIVDNAGKVHWFSGTQLIQVVRNPVTNTWSATGSYFPDAIRQLLYWNDGELVNCKPQVIASVENFVPNGAPFQTLATGNNSTRQTYNVIGPVSMPTPIFDANGDVYVIYAAGVLGTSNDGTSGGQYYRDLYLQRLTFPGSNTVQTYVPKNISRDLRGITDGTASLSEESVFPSAVHNVVNGKIHYQWMSDFEPGNALQPMATPDPEVENAVMYDAIDVASVNWTTDQLLNGAACIPTAVSESKNLVNFASVAPNPTTGNAVLTLEAKQAINASVTVRDVLGRPVLTLPARELQQGINKLNLDLSNLRPGVYTYTVSSDKFTLTQRVVKQ